MTNGSVHWNTIILAIATLVGSLTPILLALINRKAGKTLANSELMKKDTEETKLAAHATSASVEKVHVAVNSERTRMLAELSGLRDLVLDLSKKLATLEERARPTPDP